MYVTRTRRHVRDLPQTAPPPQLTPRPRVFSLKDYHIQNGRGPRILQDILAARIGGFDLIILMKNNITDQVYLLDRVNHVQSHPVLYCESG